MKIRTKLPRSSGFTLIELLVVIAIIAILSAILFPVFAQAREKARSISCLSNLKQIGVAFLQYNQDSDEYFPGLYQGNWNSSTGRWMDSIQPYIKSTQVFNCPSDSNAANKYIPNRGLLDLSATNVGGFGSYAASNAYWGNGGNAGGSQWAGPMSGAQNVTDALPAIESPSTTFLAGDGNGSFQLSWAFNAQQPTAIDAASTPPNTLHGTDATNTNLEGMLVARHQNRTNVIFCDGHAKSMTLSSLLTTSAQTTTTCGTWETPTNHCGLVYFTRADDGQ
ncbi:hypothetical protein CCAX7_51970 [Capsulimonas corticalis]|uniref:Uncharacterized protein n=2 Tax=Capsulimonas corticalis TaxID=2219043 RepID=A0A402CNV8_9BACT|nr:hypothetical protein CCAX7_51970 [Capsulimonas corticalis]